jgi:ABC-type branched-subunit amino acid transport system substrate-binding protein
LPSAIDALLQRHNRFIALIGDGVPGSSLITDRPYNTQFAQGYDLYQGVQHALRNPALKNILAHVGVLYVDDGGNPRCAAEIADILSQRPELLGVIGHSTTACTKAALPAYKKSNIPVIIPAATNPALLVGHAHHSFRLPSNDYVQSLVIANVVVKQVKARSVFIVWDATDEAKQYSEYIKTEVQHFLTATEPLGLTREEVPVIEGVYPISLNPLNYSYLFRRIVSSEPDVVIFAGYGSLAREFLFGLSHEYATYPTKRLPQIILTDGCKIPGLQAYGFPVYITFAAKPLSNFPVFSNFDAGVPIGAFQKMYLMESYEVFGYDAATIFYSAIADAASRRSVSRAEIIATVAAGARFLPTAYQYEFVDGENIRDRYYCYSVKTDSVEYKYEEEALAPFRRKQDQRK